MASNEDLHELEGELKVEWKVKASIIFSDESNVQNNSPIFYFAGHQWNIRLYPNGNTENKSVGFLSLYIVRKSYGDAVKLHYSLTLKNFDKTFGPKLEVFNEINSGWGSNRFLSKSLLKEKNVTSPTEFIITCTLKTCEPNNTAGSIINRYEEVIDNLRKIFETKKRSDCVLKTIGGEIKAHRMILESRSPVFAAMFNHDTKENRTGEISADDIEISTMEKILEYMYTGDVSDTTKENVFSLYNAAEKYDIPYIKEVCLKFIMKNLSVNWICDVIKFNDLYEDKKLDKCVRQYFQDNVREIMKTGNWKTFAKENPHSSNDLLSSVITALIPEKNS